MEKLRRVLCEGHHLEVGLRFQITAVEPPNYIQSLKQWSPTLLAPRTSFLEDKFSTDQGGGWFGDDSSTSKANLRRWWRTGEPSKLQFMGSQSRTQLSDWTAATTSTLRLLWTLSLIYCCHLSDRRYWTMPRSLGTPALKCSPHAVTLCSKTFYASPMSRKQSPKASGKAGRASVWNVLYKLPWVHPSGYTLPEFPMHGLPSSFLCLYFKPNPHPPPSWSLFYLRPTASLSSGPLKCLPAIPFPWTESPPNHKTAWTTLDSLSV